MKNGEYAYSGDEAELLPNWSCTASLQKRHISSMPQSKKQMMKQHVSTIIIFHPPLVYYLMYKLSPNCNPFVYMYKVQCITPVKLNHLTVTIQNSQQQGRDHLH